MPAIGHSRQPWDQRRAEAGRKRTLGLNPTACGKSQTGV